MGAGTKFLLLLWKNYLIQKRKIILTLFEIGVPTLFALILVLIRQRIIVTRYDWPHVWEPFSVEKFEVGSVGPIPWGLAYSPKTPVTTRLAQDVAGRLNMRLNNFGKDLGFNNESALVDYLTTSNSSTIITVLGGIVFSDGLTADGNNITNQVQYKIRLRAGQRNRISLIFTSDWYTEIMFPLRPDISPRSNSTKGGSPNYAREGFLTLQRAVDLAIMTEAGGADTARSASDIDLELRRFPYPEYIDDRFILVIQQQFPFIILLSFIITAANIVKDVVLEKERKLKESMKMMGMPSWLHWSAWLVKYLVFMLLSVIVMTILFCVKLGEGAILTYSDGSLVFVFLIVYSLSIISFCFAISTFFSKSNSGAAAGCILYLVSYIPYFFLQSRYSSLNLATKIGMCIFNNVGMAFGCQQIAFYESTGVGMQWNNFYKPVNVDDNFTMAHVFLMLIVDSVFYGLITWYFDAVLPGDYGVPKPLYFPFTRKYWCGTSTSKVSDDEVEMSNHNDSPFFEKDPTDVTAGISIHGLNKVFKRRGVEKVAVCDLKLNMYEGQITALLGHNGAGKTTTISMLTGFLPPTSGSAVINGYNIRTDIDRVRESLGLCPQHDVLFDELTVTEHLTFFARLKGMTGSSVKDEVINMVKLLHLENKANVQSNGLSGGMKRKLSVGIALIGGSKVVILDEPTSGMDPEARRQTWDLLQGQRAGRTMVLTTHFMDEADLLGDRIAIMAEGEIRCSGSSLFLKNKYGVGYHMVMVKEPGCDVSTLSDVIMKHVPGAQLESNISAELSFVLPHESSSSFEGLFTYLESNRNDLGISSYGASVTTLEEVFLKVGESMDDTLKQRLQKGAPDEPHDGAAVVESNLDGQMNNTERVRAIAADIAHVAASHYTEHASPEMEIVDDVSPSTFSSGKLIIESDNWHPETTTVNRKRNLSFSSRKYGRQTSTTSVFGSVYTRKTGLSLYVQQFKALFIKRVLHSWRNRLVTLTQLLVPLFFTTIGCTILKTFPSNIADPPPLSLSMKSFTEQTVLYETNTSSDEIKQLTEAYSYVMENTQTGVEKVESVPSVMTEMLTVGRGSMAQYNRDYMVGAGFRPQTPVENVTSATSLITGYFNNQAYHTIAISLSMVQNALFRYLLGNTDHRIETINHPLPRPQEDLLEQDMASQLAVAFIVSYNIMFGMAFLVGTFSVFLIKERSVKSKHIQYVSGVHSVTYWFSTFAWDFANYLLPSLTLLLLFLAFDIQAYITGTNLAYIFLIFLLYGWAVLPFIYLLSHLFTVPSTGYVWITVLNIFTGTAAVLAILILNIPQLGTEDVAKVLQWVFYALLPNFAFGSSLQDFFINYESKRACTREDIADICLVIKRLNRTNGCCPDACGDNCIVWQDNALALQSPGIGRACLFMGGQGFVFMVAILIMESGAVSRLWQRMVEGANTPSGDGTSAPGGDAAVEAVVGPDGSLRARLEEDSDVRAERERIAHTPLEALVNSDALVLSEIVKYYGNFLAVDRLSVGVPHGECFGLLGVNGAGKTTTFKMMTGDHTVSAGDAFLEGFSVKRNIKEVQQRLGYCPQFDALIEQMTVEETLYMYARLRGVDEDTMPDVVDKLITSLLLEKYAKKQAGDLSGGNKRKLSTAIALVGDPPIVFLDEPTTGMDPVARRLLWDTLTQVRASGRTLILTSHSMEECEALCTRIAIMVNGQFKCLGSTQHLKNKFGEGYTLMTKVSGTTDAEITERTRALMTFVERQFPNHVLKDVHQGLAHYQILERSLTWAHLFGVMEAAKEQYNIEDYSVSQTTLEQVFINFARTQRPPTITEMGCGAKCCNCCRFVFCGGCCSGPGKNDPPRSHQS